MGKRGPKPKLSALDRLDGFPSKKAMAESGLSTVVAAGEPFAADHLRAEAKAVVETIKASMPPGVYAKLDSYLLAAFASAYAIYAIADKETQKPGFEFVYAYGNNGAEAPSPWLNILRNHAMLLATLGDRLGLDPKSRQALKIKLNGEEKPKTKFDGLLGRADDKPAQLNS